MDDSMMPDTQDMGDLYINFSDDEAASESRDREPLPSGKYLMAVTDVEMREVKDEESPNRGKPMYSFEFTVLDDRAGGRLKDRKAWTLAMLFKSATGKPSLFTITHIMKACGFTVTAGQMRIPRAEEFMGKVLVVGGQLKPESKDKRDPSKTYPPQFRCTFFAKAETWQGGGAGTASGRTAAGAPASSLLS